VYMDWIQFCATKRSKVGIHMPGERSAWYRKRDDYSYAYIISWF
jgi:hypothetical protein